MAKKKPNLLKDTIIQSLSDYCLDAVLINDYQLESNLKNFIEVIEKSKGQ